MRKQVLLLAVFMSIGVHYAQEQKEIKKEDVLVEFSFNPTLSNVFKLQTNPTEIPAFSKKKISYQINSKGVVSDFVPIPKSVTYVTIDVPKRKHYKNYIYGAFGLYNNAEFELLIQPKAVKNYDYGLQLFHYNAQNGIGDKKVDNAEWNTDIAVFLAKKTSKLDWKTKLNYQYHHIHWYGINDGIQPQIYQNQQLKQVYQKVNLSAKLTYKNTPLKKLLPSIEFFSDNYKSSEIDVKLGTVLKPTFLNDDVNVQLNFQYLNGGFNQSYGSASSINYSFMNVKATPSYTYKSDSFKLDVGVGLFLNSDTENEKANFWVLPKLQTSIVLLQNIMNLHAGVGSKVHQNSYASLVAENPFVSPTLNIKTGATLADFFVGLEGVLTKKIKYNTKASFKKIKNQILYIHQNENLHTDGGVISVNQPFYMGNSFGVIYDDVNVFSVKGDVSIDFSDRLNFGADLTFNQYNTRTQKKAWNLPNFKAKAYANYQIHQFFTQASVCFIGNRYDVINTKTTKLDGFFDINLKTGYLLNKKFNIHLNIYNLLNNNYQLYSNYNVQGFQAVAGLSYKF